MTIELAGEAVALLPFRAVWWAARRTLLVADLHLGKAATFRAAGIAVPESTTERDLERLSFLVCEHRAERMVILGDLLHAKSGRTDAVMDRFADWRRERASLEVLLVRGNHDRASGDPPSEWRINVVAGPHAEAPFVFAHEPDGVGPRDTPGYVLAGHLHPAVSVGRGPGSVRSACFWFGARVGVLPAFGAFTGMRAITPSAGDRVFAVSELGVVDVSRAYSPSPATRMATS